MTANQRLNWIFGSVVALLAVVAATAMVLNLNRPVIREPSGPSQPSSTALPENHPPLDALNRVTTLTQAIEKDPKNADLRVQLGNAYYDAGLYKEAAQAYEEGIALNPQGPDVETDLSTCYHYTGQDDRALEILNRVLQKNPGFAPALFNKGIVLQAGKADVQGAIAAWEELLRLNPNHPQRVELERRIRDLKSAAK
jgi:tetratricopeptide (TPR) repeat protein